MSYLDGEWYVYHNTRLDDPLWQARTVEGDNLIASAYTQGHIDRIVREHNALIKASVVLRQPTTGQG